MSDQRCSDDDQTKRDIPSFIEPRPPLITNPFMRPRPQKRTNLLELFEEDSECEEPELVQVYLRLKPCNVPSNLYEVRSDRCLITSVDTATAGHGRRTQHNVSKMYTFSQIFGPESSQKEIFEYVVKDNLKKLPDGHNFTLLTYGASGSGKTYTLMGTVGSPGLVPRSLEYVFRVVDAAQQPLYKPADGGADKLNLPSQEYELQWVKKLRQVSAAPLRDKYRRMSVQLRNDMTSTMDLSNRTRYYVWVSFVEIYNEGIYDLLSNSDRSKMTSKLRIREDASGNAYVKGATQAFVRTGEEAYDVMVAGKHNLQVAATGVHAHSSRSHCIFTITMLSETESGVRTSCVRLCDLAGCERARQTRNTGARMQESRAINSSLHVLERCLNMLRRKQRQRVDSTLVPYRESKLTRLLGAGLSGARGEAVSMVVTLNPSPEYAHETRHVLQLAAVAKDIQVNHTIAESTLESSTTDSTYDASLELMKLRADNDRLHFELAQAESHIKELRAAMEEKQQAMAKTMSEIVEEAKDMTRQYYEAQLTTLRAEMEDMQDEYETALKAVQTAGVQRRSDVSTPTSRSLQKKVAELMTEIAILEEKLTAERLARARAEEEVQHLRACIDERDEKAEDENVESNEIVLTDSESEDEDDPCNESLEPIFKKEDINRSRLLQQSLISESINKSQDNNSNCDSENDTVQDSDINDSVLEKSGDTLKAVDNSHDDTTKDSIYLTGESETSGKLRQDKDTPNETVHMVQPNDSEDTKCTSIKELDGVENSDKDKSTTKPKSFLRETYFVQNLEVSQNVPHGKDVNNVSIDSEKFSTGVLEKIEKKEQTIKTTFCKFNSESDVSLAQFEQLEIEANTNNSKSNNIEVFPNTKILNDKSINKPKSFLRGTYFVKNSEISENVSHDKDVNNISTDSAKSSTSVLEKVEKKEHAAKKTFSKSNYESDVSLAQFEQLEIETNTDSLKTNNTEVLSDIKILKEKRKFFDDNSEKDVENLVTVNLEKKTYFNNIDIKYTDKRVNEIAKNFNLDDERSPSIVKDDVTNDFEPNKIRKLLGESFTRQPDLISTVHKVLPKKHMSVDIFEGFDSPLNVKPKEKVDKFETVGCTENTKTLETHDNTDKKDFDSKLEKQPDTLTNKEFSLKPVSVLIEKLDLISLKEKTIAENNNSDIEKPKLNKTADIIQTVGEKQVELINDDDQSRNIVNKTIDFKIIEKPSCSKDENLEKDGKSMEYVILDQKSNQSAGAEMNVECPSVYNCSVLLNNNDEKLIKSSAHNTIEDFEDIYKDITAPRATEFDLLVSQEFSDTKINETIEQGQNDGEKTKYNLRHKINTSNQKEEKELKDAEDVFESRWKSESKPKRNLRLRRRKNQTEDDPIEDNTKLKDIVNLQKEFCDVTMDVPAVKKDVIDIPSPERTGEENQPPAALQSCPSKSVTRSRRKLFTPRPEPLEESIGPGDSDDTVKRICVPRPSYHRATRVRRKL